MEIVRNLPLLLQLFFWYFAVLKSLPGPRQSHVLPGGAFLNVRGLYLPAPVPQPGFEAVAIAFGVGLLARDRPVDLGAAAASADRTAPSRCSGRSAG